MLALAMATPPNEMISLVTEEQIESAKRRVGIGMLVNALTPTKDDDGKVSKQIGEQPKRAARPRGRNPRMN
ncbi:MAG: hypothetical protein ACRDQZ_13255 [Mycobacteriales bacterium]